MFTHTYLVKKLGEVLAYDLCGVVENSVEYFKVAVLPEVADIDHWYKSHQSIFAGNLTHIFINFDGLYAIWCVQRTTLNNRGTIWSSPRHMLGQIRVSLGHPYDPLLAIWCAQRSSLNTHVTPQMKGQRMALPLKPPWSVEEWLRLSQGAMLLIKRRKLLADKEGRDNLWYGCSLERCQCCPATKCKGPPSNMGTVGGPFYVPQVSRSSLNNIAASRVQLMHLK